MSFFKYLGASQTQAQITSQRYSSTSNKLNNSAWNIPRYFSDYHKDGYKFLNPCERRTINQFALDLFRSGPAIHSSIIKKNEWACATGWLPQFKGENTEWGKRASEYLNEVSYPNCSILGSNMTFNRLLLTIANQLDIAGDILIVFTVTRDGLPRLALYPSNLVGQRGYYNNNKNTVESGRYKGATIDDGVILNSTGTPIAFHVLQNTEEEDFDISVRDAQLLFEPTELTNRGISLIAPSLLSFLDLDDIATYVNRGVKNEQKTGLVVSTETGTGDDYVKNPLMLNPATAPATVTTPHVVEVGDVMFVNAKTGEKVETLKSDRPHSNSQAWIRYVEEKALDVLGWPLALISPEKLTGANAGLIESQVQRNVEVRQQTLKRVARWFTQFSIARAMESGQLPQINTADWRAWDWSMPPEFFIKSPDQTDIQCWSVGTKTLHEISARNGISWEATRQQRQIELNDAILRANELVKTSSGQLSFERALTLIGVGSTQVSPKSEQTISTNDGE